MTDIVEVANKLYNRSYVSCSRDSGRFGEVLTFKGTGGELTILESEMQFHLKRAEEKVKKAITAEFEKRYNLYVPESTHSAYDVKQFGKIELKFNKPFYSNRLDTYKLIGTAYD